MTRSEHAVRIASLRRLANVLRLQVGRARLQVSAAEQQLAQLSDLYTEAVAAIDTQSNDLIRSIAMTHLTGLARQQRDALIAKRLASESLLRIEHRAECIDAQLRTLETTLEQWREAAEIEAYLQMVVAR